MLKLGSKGPEVGAWQAFLNLHGADPKLNPDGDFGRATDKATRAWQEREKLDTDGIVAAGSYQRAYQLGWRVDRNAPYPFVPARWFTPAEREPSDISLVVIHTMEVAETDTSAEAVARGFANRPASRAASAHYNIDNNSIVQSVLERDLAWHAGAVNGFSIGLEHAGYAGQTVEQWADKYSTDMLKLSASLSAQLVRRYSIPVVWLTPGDLLAGKRAGFTGHADINKAWKGTHWDPGPNFPKAYYLELIQAALAAG